MNRAPRPTQALLAALAAGALLAGTAPLAATAAPTAPTGGHHAPDRPQLEDLDRGLVALSTSEGVFVSWRLLASEVTGSTETGVSGPAFLVRRDGVEVATVTDSTNFVDPDGTADATYTVTPVTTGIRGNESAPATPADDDHLDIPLQRPDAGVTPAGEAYDYRPHDTSVADVDGDGALELIVKWDPSNSKDVSIVGYTGEVFIDTYRLDGELLNRISLGPNIRAGSHYTQFLAYDFDGDGRSELMLKTAPGSKSTTYEGGEAVDEEYITLPRRDRKAGVSHDDDYRLSNDDFRAHLTELFLGWSEREEVRSGAWPATLEEAWGAPVTHEYPLSRAAAEELTEYFIDVYAPSRSDRNKLDAYEGFIVDGPEYLTVFDGLTGAELDTVDYEPGRGDDGLLWGDYALPRIEPANRVDRFLSGVAYLDGEHPSAIFSRGYYTRATIAAYDWDGDEIEKRWLVDSGHVPMTNPFNDNPHGRDGTDDEFKTLTNQGYHSLSAADVDGDGRHEIVYGAATIDDDGSLLYSSFAETPPEAEVPNTETRLGHGDVLHVTDIDPDRPGLEIFSVHENKGAPYAIELKDAATGEVIWGEFTGTDVQYALIGDIRPDVRGIEVWSPKLPESADLRGVVSATGELLSREMPAKFNQTIHWSPDLTTQTFGTASETDLTAVIEDWQRGRVLTADGTKVSEKFTGMPSLVADVLGDWREELLVPGADGASLHLYVSTEPTTHKLPTPLHDLQYRAEVARQQTTYNQPSYTSYYLASDMDFADVPVLTEEITPTRPVKTDRPGGAHDTIQLPRTTGVDWYVNGEPASVRSLKAAIRSGSVHLVAVPEPWYRFAAGAQTEWEFTLGR